MTPTDELRTAAATLRSNAEAAHRASPGPWTITEERVIRCADGMIVADRSSTEHPAEHADLPFIAAMDPTVGLALADWLEEAARQEAYTRAEFGHRGGAGVHALAIARAINGSQP
ncbi:hypothetical protein GPA10_05075 [Streptomyces sp. p1417]|uniref:Uncharacterized protein n=1 Tax=Streptomyces typhae TaxID=2681492 RepID=A0A6L6WRL1_9ACTN|nr:hypothetical protein [Streptomyces typhae]MVO84158.1 hypothetical protein [Streptomyces typhae]